MSSVLLFSQLTETNKSSILDILFPAEGRGCSFAYMPSNGLREAKEYIPQWEDIAHEYGYRISVIDNTSSNLEERAKLLNADVLLISGGNTFQLLNNLRQSGMDKGILEFSRKNDSMLAGFSAGALVLTPTIQICNLPGFDDNLIGLDNFEGLGIVDFELFPHYEQRAHYKILSEYQKTTNNQVRLITDEECIIISS